MLNRLKNYVAIFCFFGIFSYSIASEIYDDTPTLEDIAVALVRTRSLLDPHQSYIQIMETRPHTEENKQAKIKATSQTFGKIVQIYKDRLMRYDFSEIGNYDVLFLGDIHEVFLNRNSTNYHYQKNIIYNLRHHANLSNISSIVFTFQE